MLVDGRNRLEACTRAKVKPATVTLNGEDPTAFVLSANIHRRHMNSGQRAVATAMLYPDGGSGGRGKKKAELSSEFSSRYLRQARSVLRHSKATAEAVLIGAESLSSAYKEARDWERQDAAKAEDTSERLAKLRESDLDLAEPCPTPADQLKAPRPPRRGRRPTTLNNSGLAYPERPHLGVLRSWPAPSWHRRL
jgi:hypothetical protein